MSLAVVGPLLFGGCSRASSPPGDLFAEWRSLKPGDRVKVGREIHDRKLLSMKPRNEVELLLGAPDPRRIAMGDLTYFLGSETFAFGETWLAIDFDESGIVSNTFIVVE